MKRFHLFLVSICVFLLFAGPTGTASAALITLDFEDLSSSGSLPEHYAGLSWDSHWNYYGFYQPPYNPSSGIMRIYSHNYGGWIDFGEEVTFYGSWVATTDAISYDEYAQEVYWQGFRDEVLMYTSESLYGGDCGWINVSWEDVDMVRFVSTSFNHFILDDISYDPDPGSAPDPSPVAEPATLMLIGTGLLGLAGTRKRKRV